MTPKAFSFLTAVAIVAFIILALAPARPTKNEKKMCCQEKKCEKKEVQPADNMMIDNISRQFIAIPITF